MKPFKTVLAEIGHSLKQLKINKRAIVAGICRTLLGLVFIFSGAVKAIDPWGTVYKIEDYLREFGGYSSNSCLWLRLPHGV